VAAEWDGPAVPRWHHFVVPFVAPMLLATAREWIGSEDFALEPKWDGFRMLAARDGAQARCWSRHGTEMSAGVGAVLAELRDLLPHSTVVDGELVVLARAANGDVGQDFNKVGRTVFGRQSHALTFVVFDTLQVAGQDLTRRPWHERRSALEDLLAPGGQRVILTDVFAASESVHDDLVALGFEGSVLKRRDGRYRPGQRSSTWRKVKARSRCSAVIEAAARDRESGVVERVGCRAADDPQRLTWAVVWDPALRRELTRDVTVAVGRHADLAYTHRTVAGALREARLTALR
jgi:bifunctional non-homologous end joining protein LigD